ncbi:MAG: DEAD/DEAH box helicase [Proteobacteria bacterium]|nr:DEAD/DEAH box helicase [Pseudomonadota bacterium]
MSQPLKTNEHAVLTVSNECFLAQAGAGAVGAIIQELTIDNPKYVDAVKYGRWVGKRIKPKLTFYSKTKKGLFFPRGFANEAILLLRQFDGQNPEIVDKRRSCPEVIFEFSASLRPYQHEAVEAVVGRQFGVLESGTGSGKTVMALAIIARRRQPTLIIVHNKELLYQWQERVKQFLGFDPGLIGDGHFEIAPISIAIVNTARNRLAELTDHFGQICVDECHRVPASLFTDVVTGFDCMYMLGLSATAFRRDGMSQLINIFLGDLVHRVDKEELAAVGAVLKPALIQKPTAFTFRFHDNYQDLMKALTTDEHRNRQIVDDIIGQRGRSEGGILVVSDRVAHCELLAEMLAERDVHAKVLTGRTSSEERSATVDEVHNGKLQILISTLQLIGEGFDCPGLATLFLTTPIKFTGRLQQVVGRILRPSPGKKAMVFDYVDENVGVLSRSAEIRRESLVEKPGALPGFSTA